MEWQVGQKGICNVDKCYTMESDKTPQEFQLAKCIAI